MSTPVKVSVEVPIVVDTCPVCGVIYGVLAGFDAGHRKTHDTFYCPNGHGICYPAPTPPVQSKPEPPNSPPPWVLVLTAFRYRVCAARLVIRCRRPQRGV